MSRAKSDRPPASVKEPRREPVQERSRDTVRVILEATTLLLQDGENVDTLTMKDIARRAGVSDATLYRFFLTKESLLAAWEEAQMNRILEAVLDVGRAEYARQAPMADGLRAVVRTGMMLLMDLGDLYGRAPSEGLLSRREVRDARVQALLEGLTPLVMRSSDVRPADRAAGAEVMVLTVLALAFVRRQHLTKERLADEVADMIVRYFVADGRAGT